MLPFFGYTAECTKDSSWGQKFKENGETCYCYNGICHPEDQTIIGSPCGTSEGSSCQLKNTCSDEEWSLGGSDCGDTKDGENIVCCESAGGCEGKKWSEKCTTSSGVSGYCYNGICETKRGEINDPCGKEEGSKCLSSCPSSYWDKSTDSRKCNSNNCCKKEYTEDPKFDTKCRTKYGGECRARCDSYANYHVIELKLDDTDCKEPTGICCVRPCYEVYNGGSCKDFGSCSQGMIASTQQECSKEGKVCCIGEKNVCTELNGTCATQSPELYRLSTNEEANDACVNLKGPYYQCFVKPKCLINGGKCVSQDIHCGTELKRYSASCGDGYKCCANTVSGGYDYDNPLGVSSVTEWLGNLLSGIQSIVGWLAVIMIFVGGIMYIFSGGSQGQVTLAKNIIIAALVGFAIAVAAPSFLKELKDLMDSGGGSGADAIDNANSFKNIAINVLKFLLGVVGTLALIGFAIGGVLYLTAFGDQPKTDLAKKMVLYSIIAIGVSGASIILLNSVLSFLSGTLK